MQMFRRGGRSIAVLTAVLVSTLTLAPAFAAKQVTRDTRGDVASLFFDPEAVGLPVPTPVPDETSADITRTVVRHTARRVIVKVHFRDALAHRAPAMYLNLTTPDTQFEVNYDKTSIEPLMILKRGRNVACKGAKSAFPLDADIATISFPAGAWELLAGFGCRWARCARTAPATCSSMTDSARVCAATWIW